MSSSEFDSEEDLPIAALGKRYEVTDDESDEAEFDGGDKYEEDNEESEEEYEDAFIADEDATEKDDSEDDDYSDDDDVPLKDLKTKNTSSSSPSPKKSSKSKSPAAKKKKPSSAKKAKPSKSKKAAAKKKKKKNIEMNKTSASTLVTASSELYSKSEKGRLIQSLLCRWWYAYTWPDPSSLPEDTPKNYDAFDGFPGVYVCTSGDDVGKIKDYRDKSACPNFNNFSRKTSEILQELLLTAIKNQREALIQAEGSGTTTERELKDLEKWATKLNVKKSRKRRGQSTESG
mmetsp:Transcript_18724/g.18033  ORF Transcript_18724/g.18033 Transcript_18724/m.18033 type:complete len:288 (-) Transcript_18724:71-934(-)